MNKYKTIKSSESEEKYTKKQFTEAEIFSKLADFKHDIFEKIGDGKYSINLSTTKDGFRIDFLLYVKGNEPTYNFLCDKMYWTFAWQFLESNVLSSMTYEGLLKVCEEIAIKNNIHVKITDWTAENICLNGVSLYNLAREQVGLKNLCRWQHL